MILHQVLRNLKKINSKLFHHICQWWSKHCGIFYPCLVFRIAYCTQQSLRHINISNVVDPWPMPHCDKKMDGIPPHWKEAWRLWQRCMDLVMKFWNMSWACAVKKIKRHPRKLPLKKHWNLLKIADWRWYRPFSHLINTNQISNLLTLEHAWRKLHTILIKGMAAASCDVMPWKPSDTIGRVQGW